MKRNEKSIWQLIFFTIFLSISLLNFYLAFVEIKVWENSPEINRIRFSNNESILKPIVDLTKIYDHFGFITNFIAGIGLLIAALTAAYSYNIEKGKLDRLFWIIFTSILIVFIILLIFLSPSKFSPCIGCDKIYILGNGCINNFCYVFNDGTKAIVRECDNSTNFTVGEHNWIGQIVLYKNFQIRNSDRCSITVDHYSNKTY